jgi:hypothetical protein
VVLIGEPYARGVYDEQIDEHLSSLSLEFLRSYCRPGADPLLEEIPITPTPLRVPDGL